MTTQEYIQSKLDDLCKPLGLRKPADDEQLAEAIFKIIMSKKFRKYSANLELIEHTKNAIRLSIKKREPINFTFFHGAYKLWRLDESPEVDWAELFALMYYTSWLKGICEIYEPGVWFDFFVDDLIVPKIDNIDLSDIKAYRESYQKLIDFLKQYQPVNFKMTITGVGEQFESPEAFERKLQEDIKRHAATLSGGLPMLSESQIAMIELNAKVTSEQKKDPKWREKIALMHDAYISITKRETGYHFMPNKIKVFTKPLPSGTVLAVGTTKDSVAKFWAGVGALKPRDGSYRQVVLSPKQLKVAKFEWEDVNMSGLNGKNFRKVRLLSS